MDFLALKGTAPTVAAMKSLADGVPVVLPSTSEVRIPCCENLHLSSRAYITMPPLSLSLLTNIIVVQQTALFAGITLFIRLLQLAKKDRASPASFKALAEQVRGAGGLELCLQIMDKCEDELLSKACSKLLSLLFDSSSIEELIRSMNDGSLSAEMQQHVLRMLASLAVDPASSADIVRFGGVSVLVSKARDETLSARLLDMSIKALLYLSSSRKNIPQMVADNAIETLVRTIIAPLDSGVSDVDLQLAREIKANAVHALKNICVLQEHIPRACGAGAVEAMLHCLSEEQLRVDVGVAAQALQFLEMLVNSSHESSEDTRVNAPNGSSNGILLQHMTAESAGVIRQVILDVCSEDVALHCSALRVLHDLSLSSPSLAASLIQNNFVDEIVATLADHGKDNVALLHVCLHVLWTLLLASNENVAASVASSHNNTGVDIVLGCIGHKIRVEAIRKVGVQVIGLLASSALVKKVVARLNKMAAIPMSDLNRDAVGDVALVAITVGVLAMVPEHLAAIFSLGGVAPMILLLSNIVLIPFQDDDDESGAAAAGSSGNVYHEALTALCSALEEVISSADILQVPNLLETIRACVGVLQKHPKLLNIVQSALHLLGAISSSPQRAHRQLCIDNDILEAIGNILRANPSSARIVHSVTKIYSNFSESDDEMAIVICRRNASKMIISSLEKNLSLLSLDGSTLADGAGVVSTPHSVAQMIVGFLPILYRLSTILPEGRDVLRRQGALGCLCDTFEKFHLLQSLDHLDRPDIRDWCLKIVRLLLEEADVLETLNRLEKKKDSTRPGLFSLTEKSVDHVNAASQDVLRLGLLMLCGPQVVQQIEAAGGITLLYECLYHFSPAVNTAVCESSLVSRARDKFINLCIQALGRAALGHMDVQATLAIIPLLVAAAKTLPTVAVFVAMTHLGRLHESVVEALVQAGAVEACLAVCQADLDIFAPDVVAAAFSCLALLASNEQGLALIVQNNAINLICQFISETLNVFEEEMELTAASSSSSSSQLSSIRSALSMLLALVGHHDTSVDGQVNQDILQVICQLIDVFVMLSAASSTQQAKQRAGAYAASSAFTVDFSEQGLDGVDSSTAGTTSAADDEALVFPDLLAITMDVVKVLVAGDQLGEQYCTALIERQAVRKLDALMTANDDAYLLVTKTAYAMGHLWHLLVVQNRNNTGVRAPPPPPPPPPPPGRAAGASRPSAPPAYTQADSRGYVGMLQSKDFILRTMNFHPKEMALLKLLAAIVGGLGLDGGSSGGLAAFLDQLQASLDGLCAANLQQLTQLLQLLGNLLLVDGMLTQDLGDALFNMLLEACRRLQALSVEPSSAEHRTLALQVSIVAMTMLRQLLNICVLLPFAHVFIAVSQLPSFIH